jgi:hypothetical protein
MSSVWGLDVDETEIQLQLELKPPRRGERDIRPIAEMFKAAAPG